MAMFGWCLTGQHASCVEEINLTSDVWDVRRCSCICHIEEGNGG